MAPRARHELRRNELENSPHGHVGCRIRVDGLSWRRSRSGFHLHGASFLLLLGSGCVPTGDLVLDDSGNVFGTTATGSQSGTIFQYAPSTNAFRFLFNFNGSGDGAKPQGSLLLKDGKLYGTAASGGANNAGTVYQLNLASASLTTCMCSGGRTTAPARMAGWYCKRASCSAQPCRQERRTAARCILLRYRAHC